MSKRIKTVTELAKHCVGDIAYWVVIRPLKPIPQLDEEDLWMENHHPKVLYTRGPAKKIWPYNAKLPRMHHMDFEGIVNLLRSEFVIEEFNICEIIRSKNTGEFFYANDDDEWMPESCLLDTEMAAVREKTRILKMIQKWAQK